jgi:hypothetical protein
VTHLERRLQRLEHDRRPCAGEHRAVRECVEREDATVWIFRCSGGPELCGVHPALTIVLRRERSAWETCPDAY